MTCKRVNVDAKALYNLIQAARADKESLICLDSVNPGEERKELMRLITRLDPKEITE